MPFPTTCILYTAGYCDGHDEGQTFEAVQEKLWAGDYWLAERGLTNIHVFELPSGRDRTVEALTDLAERTFTERYTPGNAAPDHLKPVFAFFGLDFYEAPERDEDPNDEHRLGAAAHGVAAAPRIAA